MAGKLSTLAMGLFVLSLLSMTLAGAPNIVSKTLTLRETRMQSTDVKLGLFDVEFDQPLNRIAGYGACPSGASVRQCAPITACPPCDYTRADICDGTATLPPNCSCTVDHAACYIPDTIVLDGPEVPFNGPTGFYQEFKVFVDFSKNETSCKQFSVHRTTFTGRFWIYIGTADYYAANEGLTDLLDFLVFAPGLITICPSSYNFVSGTIIIQAYCSISAYHSLDRMCNGTIQVTSQDLPPARPAPPPCVLPGNLSTTHHCLSDGEYFEPDYWRDYENDPWVYLAYKVPASKDGKPTTVFYSYAGQGYMSWDNVFPVVHPDVADPDNPSTPYIATFEATNTRGGNNCKFPDICPTFIDLSMSADAQNYFSVYLTEDKWLYIAFYDFDYWPWFYMESRPEYVWDHSFTLSPTTLSHYDYYVWNHNTAYLWCRDNDNNLEQFTCPRGVVNGNYNTGCATMWYPMPLADPNPFFPMPSFAQYLPQWQYLRWLDGMELRARPNHYMIAATVRINTNGQGLEVLRLNGNLSNLATCELTMQGNYAVESWTYGNAPWNTTGINIFVWNTPISGWTVMDLADHTDVVTPEGLEHSRTRTRYWLEQLEGADGAFLSNIQYQLNVLRFQMNMARTEDYVKSLYIAGTANVTIPDSQWCYVYDPTDPCCDFGIGWDGPSCVPRPTQISVPVLDSVVESIASECGDQDCITTFLRDAVTLAANENLGSCEDITEGIDYFRRRLLDGYMTCRDEHLGRIADTPTACRLDEDCASFGVKCDTVRGMCLVPLATRFNNFMQCFLNTTEPLVIIKLAELHGLSVANNPSLLTDVATWANLYTTTEECSDPQGFDWGIRARSRYCISAVPSVPDGCFDKDNSINAYCGFDDFAYTPLKCRYVNGYRSSAYSGLCQTSSCNWFYEIGANVPSVTTRNNTCFSKPNFCGWTDNGWDYSTTDLNETECNQAVQSGAVICIHNDGTTTIEASVAACEAIQTCSYPGIGNDTARCAEAGYCGNDYLGPTTLEGEFTTRVVGADGACVMPFGNAFIGQYCDVSSTNNFRDALIGCIHLGFNKSECEAAGAPYEWVYTPKNRSACESIIPPGKAHNEICVRPTDPFISSLFFNNFVITEQNEADCLASGEGARWIPRNSWTPATMRHSVARNLSWVPARFRVRYESGLATPNVFGLFNDLMVATDNIRRYQIKSTTFCTYSRLTDNLETFACSCLNGENRGEECFPETDSLSALTEACGGASSAVVTPPISLSISSSSVSPLGSCLQFGVKTISHLGYKTTEGKGAASYFIDFSEKTDYSFRNTRDALIGQIVGDGFALIVTNDTSGARLSGTVRACSTRNFEIEIQYPNKYTVYDWAQLVDGSGEVKKFKLVNSETTEQTGSICSSFIIESGVEYFPVMRIEGDFDQVQPDVFTLAEFIIICILIIAYAGMIIFIIVKLRYIVIIRAFPFSAGVCIPLAALYIVRLIYFSLLVANQFVVNNNSLGLWVLVELPLLLYFSTTIYFVINWAFVTRTIKKLGKTSAIRRLTARYFAISMAILFVIFIGFLLAFAFLRGIPSVACGGRIVDTDYSINKAIAIAYRVWMGALCAVVGAGFVIYSSSVLHAMAAMTNRQGGDDKVMKKRVAAKRNLTLMSFACSLSLFIEAVFMLVLAFLLDFRENIVSLIIMLVTEILPGLGILLILDLSEMARTAELTRSSVASTKSTTKSLRAALSKTSSVEDRTSTTAVQMSTVGDQPGSDE